MDRFSFTGYANKIVNTRIDNKNTNRFDNQEIIENKTKSNWNEHMQAALSAALTGKTSGTGAGYTQGSI
jgi:hypothetical protein